MTRSLINQRRPSWRLRGKKATASLRSLRSQLDGGESGSLPCDSSQGQRSGSLSDMSLSPAVIKEKFLKQQRLTHEEASSLISRATNILKQENNVLEIDAPCIVCGDIHGQFFDLLRLFEVGGSIEQQKYLFLGDYVDRGELTFFCPILFLILNDL